MTETSRDETTISTVENHPSPTEGSTELLAICDLDGTLIDSDQALVDAFVSLGIDRAEITFGHVLATECARFGLSVDDYIAAYDETAARPFAGVQELIDGLGEWAVCSNKHPVSGMAELGRLRWSPRIALFADAFDGPKSPRPVLERLRVEPHRAVFLGDTAHDRACAQEAGVRFVLAGWNPRAVAEPGDIVLCEPTDLLDLLRQSA